jgi:hypothetical protein
MMRKQVKKELRDVTRASALEEMARPRVARSANIAERDLDTTRIRERPSTSLPGMVAKIIPPQHTQPEKAQITVPVADHRHRDLLIENALTDENGDNAKLKKGAHVEVTVTDESQVRRTHEPS